MALDQVLLEMERLDLVAGHDRLDLGHAPDEPSDPWTSVAATLEIAAHARAQRFRLAHVEDLAVFAVEEVDARGSRKRPQLLVERPGHGAPVSLARAQRYVCCSRQTRQIV